MSSSLKKILITGASLLMFSSVGAGISNVSNAHADESLSSFNALMKKNHANDLKIMIHTDRTDPTIRQIDETSGDPQVREEFNEVHNSIFKPGYKKGDSEERYSDFETLKHLDGTLKANQILHIQPNRKVSRNHKHSSKRVKRNHFKYIHKSNNKRTRKSKKLSNKRVNHKRARKPRRKVTKHFNKKHMTKRVARKHTTRKAKNYNYLGTYKQGERQAIKDTHNGKYPSFNQLIKNKKFISNRYTKGYNDALLKSNHKYDVSSERFGAIFSVAVTYLTSKNKMTKTAYYDFYDNKKPNHYLMKHNKHYKKVYNDLEPL